MGKIQNIDKINPIKQNIVTSILEEVKQSEYVDQVIIFGSSIREDCKESSDLDIAIKWTKECFDNDAILQPFTLPVYKTISRITKGNNDVIPIGYEGNLLKDAIQEGVVVYERDDV